MCDKKYITVMLRDKETLTLLTSNVPRIGETLCFDDYWVVINIINEYDNPVKGGLWVDKEMIVECVRKIT